MEDSTMPKDTRAQKPLTPRQVAEAWFSNLERGNVSGAQALLDENVLWENIPATPGVSDLAPWLGTHHGVAEVMESINKWASYARLLSYRLVRLLVDGQEAVGIVHEHAQCLANKNEYDTYAAANLTIEDGRITHYRTYWDISPLIKAFQSI
jgi:ketosteroid isomerase-like protein